MIRLEHFISELCPNGVKYVPLGEVVSFTDGFSFSSGDFSENGTFQVVKITDIFEGKVNVGKTFIDTLPNKLKSGQLLAGGEIVVAMSGSTGKTGYNKLENAVVNQRIAILRNTSEIDNGFLKHLIVNKSFEEYCFKNGTGPQNNISKSLILKYRIPLPPLPVQQEIVRILDNFTKLTAELTAELTARRKQYEHYQTVLLSPLMQQSLSKIGDVCNVEKGNTPIQKAAPGEYPLVVTAEQRQTSASFQFNGDAVCIPLVSARGHGVASINRIYYQTGKFALGNILCAIQPQDNQFLSAKFLKHYLFYYKDILLVPLMRGGANVSLTVSSVKSVRIPIPPLVNQQRIVEILDRFDALCNDLASGLPAEIAARQKQYEYYRDKLLTFKELDA